VSSGLEVEVEIVYKVMEHMSDMSRDRIRNTSFSLPLTNGPTRLEFLSLASLSSLA
jgi:hypothetical protein